MALKVTRVNTWVASIPDRPGGVADKLAALTAAGVNLEFAIARRAADKPGTGVIFCTPIKGGKHVRAAKKEGFAQSRSLHTVRVEGTDRKGRGSGMARALASAGLNLRGFSASSLGARFVAHLALDTPADLAAAIRILKAL